MVQDRKRKFVAHHDRLLICNDRFIPLWMRKLPQEFLDLDETLLYDEAELEELNLFEAPPEVGIKDLFDNRVKYSIVTWCAVHCFSSVHCTQCIVQI